MRTEQHQLINTILGRRSIRAFTRDAVTTEQIRTLLDVAMAAPSAAAKVPWRFVVVRNRTVLTRLAEALPHGRMLADAAVGFVVCGDIEKAHDRQLSYLLQDCSAAIENLLLGAHALGLGACWLGVHPREDRVQRVKEALNLEPSIIPVSAIAVGHPAEAKEPRTRYNPHYVRYVD